jgi:hypothetical protein
MKFKKQKELAELHCFNIRGSILSFPKDAKTEIDFSVCFKCNHRSRKYGKERRDAKQLTTDLH